jgi:hypothetical protein
MILLSGCGFSELSTRTTNPVLLDLLAGSDVLGNEYRYETISTNASRRTIFVRYRKDGERSDFVCAEPSPDALQAYASAISALAKGGTTAANAALGINSTQNTSAMPILYRSQGLQLFRDQVFNLCLMRMNDNIDDEEYVKLLESSSLLAADLIRVEQKAVETAAARTPVILNPQATVESVVIKDQTDTYSTSATTTKKFSIK